MSDDPTESDAALVAFAELVKAMRDRQKEFFDRDRRRPDTVRQAKALEAQVDRTVSRILNDSDPQRELF